MTFIRFSCWEINTLGEFGIAHNNAYTHTHTHADTHTHARAYLCVAVHSGRDVLHQFVDQVDHPVGRDDVSLHDPHLLLAPAESDFTLSLLVEVQTQYQVRTHQTLHQVQTQYQVQSPHQVQNQNHRHIF